MTDQHQTGRAAVTAETWPAGGASTAAQQVRATIVAQGSRLKRGGVVGDDVWEAVITAHPALDAEASAWMDPRLEHSRAFFTDGSALLLSQDPDRMEWEVGADQAYTNGRRAVRRTSGGWERLLLDEDAAAS